MQDTLLRLHYNSTIAVPVSDRLAILSPGHLQAISYFHWRISLDSCTGCDITLDTKLNDMIYPAVTSWYWRYRWCLASVFSASFETSANVFPSDLYFCILVHLFMTRSYLFENAFYPWATFDILALTSALLWWAILLRMMFVGWNFNMTVVPLARLVVMSLLVARLPCTASCTVSYMVPIQYKAGGKSDNFCHKNLLFVVVWDFNQVSNL